MDYNSNNYTNKLNLYKYGVSAFMGVILIALAIPILYKSVNIDL